MAGLDLDTLTTLDYGDLLEDHKASFDGYVTARVAKEQAVDGASSSVRRLETPIGMFADGHRTAKHAVDAPTPVGNSAMGSRVVNVECYSWAEPINHLAHKEVEKATGMLEAISQAAGHMVLGSLDKDLANIISGNGTAGTYDDLTEKACGAVWTTTSTDARADIESVIDALRPGSQGLVCVAGWDILRILSKNTSIINNGDKVRARWQDVIDELLGMGISRVVVDSSVAQDGERQATRSYKGILDGKFYVGTENNLLLGTLNPLAYDVYYDDSRRTYYFRASMDADIVTGYAAHGYYFSGMQA